jgi:nicotinamide-nucleotide amidase
MIPESQADKLLAPIYTTYTDVETTILAHAGDIQLTLLCAKPTSSRPGSASTSWPAAWKKLSKTGSTPPAANPPTPRTDRPLLPRPPPGHPGRGRKLHRRHDRRAHHRVPGSSRSFLGGAIVYSDALKHAFAGVPPEMIAEHGAVSEEVAKALATGIRLRTGATMGLGSNRHRRPHRRTEEKPVGLVYIALSSAEKVESLEKTFRGDRNRVREWTTQQALAVENTRRAKHRWAGPPKVAGLAVGQMTTVLKDFGVRSRIEQEDYRQSLDYLVKVW